MQIQTDNRRQSLNWMSLILICLLISIYIVFNLLEKEKKNGADIILLFIILHSITASIWIVPVKVISEEQRKAWQRSQSAINFPSHTLKLYAEPKYKSNSFIYLFIFCFHLSQAWTQRRTLDNSQICVNPRSGSTDRIRPPPRWDAAKAGNQSVSGVTLLQWESWVEGGQIREVLSSRFRQICQR